MMYLHHSGVFSNIIITGLLTVKLVQIKMEIYHSSGFVCFCSDAVEVPIRLGCDAISLEDGCPLFQNGIVVSF
jgi:hypothetical protein